MSNKFACPCCGRRGRLPEELANCKVKCPKCHKKFRAPALVGSLEKDADADEGDIRPARHVRKGSSRQAPWHVREASRVATQAPASETEEQAKAEVLAFARAPNKLWFWSVAAVCVVLTALLTFFLLAADDEEESVTPLPTPTAPASNPKEQPKDQPSAETPTETPPAPKKSGGVGGQLRKFFGHSPRHGNKHGSSR